MNNVSHQDNSRKGVGGTALVVAKARSIESRRIDDGLCRDPFAELFLLEDDGVSQEIEGIEMTESLINLCVVRTRVIDDAMVSSVVEGGLSQICVLGAGLDTRPWRLASLSAVPYFEVDFSEIFDFKLEKLAASTPLYSSYIPVRCDLSLPDWQDKLFEAGFQSGVKTFFLLEGLTGYLKESENIAIFTAITSFCAPGSRLVATFLSETTKAKTTMHRFQPEDPLLWLTSNFPSWEGESQGLAELAARFSRPIDESAWGGYCIVDVIKK